MKKIPTLFRRDPNDMSRVLNEVHPGCRWVIDGEGVATRKYDGTCVRLDEGGHWWARREVKVGKAAPPNFSPVETDPATGKTVGWEPIEQSAFAKYHAQAMADFLVDTESCDPGTYELIGPKVNGNPEGVTRHQFRKHAEAEVIHDVPRDFHGLAGLMSTLPYEGIVWHHPDGRMAKLKRKDFPR